MANKQLPEFLTAENDLDGQEPVYIAQGGKTRKALLSKIKDFIIGTTALTTTDKTVTGSIEEIKEKVEDNTTQLNENTQNINNLKGYAEYNISASITIPNDTITYLLLDTVVKSESFAELLSGGIKIKENGMYEINAMANFNSSLVGHRKIGIYKNDVLFKLIAFAPNNNITVSQIISNIDCVVNDIIKIGVYQNSGSSLTNIINSPYSGVQIRRIG